MMKTKLTILRNSLEQQKGRRAQIQQEISQTEHIIKTCHKELRRHERALEIIKIIALKTQRQLQHHVAEIATLALDAVFPNPYELVAEFVERREKTECDLYFVRDGVRIDPMSASGLGAVDVAAFALRVASWSMMRPRPRPTFVLDEPFKFLKGEEANTRVLEMIREISKRLGVQIIMVSDERVPRELIEQASDATFDIRLKKGVSRVTSILEAKAE